MNELDKPAAQQVIDELASEAKSPEDQQVLDDWRAEIQSERQVALQGLGGEATGTMVQMPDGSVETSEAVQASIDRGENPSGAYSGNRRA